MLPWSWGHFPGHLPAFAVPTWPCQAQHTSTHLSHAPVGVLPRPGLQQSQLLGAEREGFRWGPVAMRTTPRRAMAGSWRRESLPSQASTHVSSPQVLALLPQAVSGVRVASSTAGQDGRLPHVGDLAGGPAPGSSQGGRGSGTMWVGCPCSALTLPRPHTPRDPQQWTDGPGLPPARVTLPACWKRWLVLSRVF